MCFYVMPELNKGIIAKRMLRSTKTVRINLTREEVSVLAVTNNFSYLNMKIGEDFAHFEGFTPISSPRIRIRKVEDFPSGLEKINEGYHSSNRSKFRNFDWTYYIHENPDGTRILHLVLLMEFFIPRGTRFFLNVRTQEYVSERISTSFHFAQKIKINGETYFMLQGLIHNLDQLGL